MYDIGHKVTAFCIQIRSTIISAENTSLSMFYWMMSQKSVDFQTGTFFFNKACLPVLRSTAAYVKELFKGFCGYSLKSGKSVMSLKRCW